MFEYGKVPAVIARDKEYNPENMNCYDYYIKNTEKYGEYNVFKHYSMKHGKKEFLSDVDALSYYFKNELGYKRGDCFTVFMPTCAEDMITFMALNKLGVIVNFVHPLLQGDALLEIMDLTESKGIMVYDMFLPKYADYIKKSDVPVIVVLPSEYALPDKYSAKISPDAAPFTKDLKKADIFIDIIKKYQGKTVDGLHDNGQDIAIYANGGGTTGNSKTIQLQNTALNNQIYMLGAQNTPVSEIGVDTEICSMPFFHAYGFCAGGLSALHKGAMAVFLPKFDADKFIEIMKTEKVTEFNGVPNMFKKLMDTPDFDGPFLKNIKVLYAGGDEVTPDFVHRMEKILSKNGSSASICAGWGLTECTAACTVNRPWKNKPGTIGEPLPGLRIEMWDENNKKVPYGQVGQIAVSGPTMMTGYLTKDRKDGVGLYTDEDGVKWVLTGDLAMYDEEGFIHFKGRTKKLIIISGYNVYPNDIEKLVTSLPFVKECCAVQGFDENNKAIVRLFTVLNDTAASDDEKEKFTEEIKKTVEDKINRFSVPRDIRFIEALPRTKLEKVDFLKLAELSPNKK